jgi:hypothetical protein
METNLARRLVTLVTATKVDINGLCTTTLRVLDSRAVLLARHVLLLALRAVVHCVVEVDLDVKLDGHVDSSDTETARPLVTAKAGWLLLGALVQDSLGTKGTLGE